MLETGTWTLTTVPALCARAAAIYGDDPAIEDGDDTISFAELDRRRRRVSRALVASGIGHGDRVMLWAPNSARWIEAALGIVGIGAVLIPVSTRFKGAEVEDLALRGGARLILSAGTFLGTDHPALLTPATRATLREVVLLDPDDAGPDIGWDRFLARADGVPEAEVDSRAAAVTPDTISDILFTSGTTGRSKGVMYAHGQFLRVVRDWTERVGLRRGDRVLVIPPFFHAFGYRGGAVGSLIVGATILPHGAYDAEAVLQRVKADRVSVIPGPPTIFHGMLGHPRMAEFDRSSLRLGITGGAVIPSVLVRRMREELGFRGVCNGYGLTECGGYGAMCRHDDPVDVIAETAGRPMPGIEIAMKDQEGRVLPPGEAGEVCIRGYIVMRGYLDDPEATARAIDAEPADRGPAEGHVHHRRLQLLSGGDRADAERPSGDQPGGGDRRARHAAGRGRQGVRDAPGRRRARRGGTDRLGPRADRELQGPPRRGGPGRTADQRPGKGAQAQPPVMRHT
jgi:acyl-CoA synthetase (AMP-forming)/AMP-acid ligase II